uniref:Uncharacterized protein n=1 Tax=Anopheles farauti TaxID=69004 RepID=A0A182QXB6_9DIPT
MTGCGRGNRYQRVRSQIAGSAQVVERRKLRRHARQFLRDWQYWSDNGNNFPSQMHIQYAKSKWEHIRTGLRKLPIIPASRSRRHESAQWPGSFDSSMCISSIASSWARFRRHRSLNWATISAIGTVPPYSFGSILRLILPAKSSTVRNSCNREKERAEDALSLSSETQNSISVAAVDGIPIRLKALMRLGSPFYLRLLVVGQHLLHEKVDAGQQRRRHAAQVQVAGHGQDHLPAVIVPLEQRHDVTAIDDGLDLRVLDVHALEPGRIGLTYREVLLQHGARLRDRVLLRAQEAQQKQGVRAAALDVRTLGDELAHLCETLRAQVLILTQLRLGRLAEFVRQRPAVLLVAGRARAVAVDHLRSGVHGA